MLEFENLPPEKRFEIYEDKSMNRSKFKTQGEFNLFDHGTESNLFETSNITKATDSFFPKSQSRFDGNSSLIIKSKSLGKLDRVYVPKKIVHENDKILSEKLKNLVNGEFNQASQQFKGSELKLIKGKDLKKLMNLASSNDFNTRVANKSIKNFQSRSFNSIIKEEKEENINIPIPEKYYESGSGTQVVRAQKKVNALKSKKVNSFENTLDDFKREVLVDTQGFTNKDKVFSEVELVKNFEKDLMDKYLKNTSKYETYNIFSM